LNDAFIYIWHQVDKSTCKNLLVSTAVKYLPEHSNAMDNNYFFMYTICIENNTSFTVKLMSRHWDIFDSSGEKKVIEGEGVVGEQPEIKPGDKYTYNSGCALTTDIGKMSGFYNLIKVEDGTTILANIPEFKLITPYRLN
jgi:ApaG protein